MPGEDHKLGPLSHLSCGALSGLLSDGLVHPLDTIRTRLQIERSHLQQEYKSSVDVFRKMLKLEGPRSLYKGFTAVAIGTIPGHAFYFMGYEASKKYLAWMTGSKHEEGGPLVHLTSGLMADVFGGLVWVPMDVVKQRMMVDRGNSIEGVKKVQYRTAAQATNLIIKEEGFRGLYTGFGAAIATFGPFVALYFMAYEQLKRYARVYYHQVDSDADLPFSTYLVAGGIGGAFAAGATCPMDVIKTRLMVEGTESSRSGVTGETKTRYKNSYHAFKTIVKEEGYSAFFKGLGPRILWMAGGTATTIAFCMFFFFLLFHFFHFFFLHFQFYLLLLL
eukprot:gb/GECH01009702.1/.p1 GENE.gb/GECH01009702.1/~~gb/GECH01009702.1/.p1  ORF type:complete len:333 (+),score=65.31 gb/GECH01009702.1/:1-999(+)